MASNNKSVSRPNGAQSSFVHRFVKGQFHDGLATLLSLADLKDPINIYLLAILLTGIFQFIYVLLVGTFPFNSFLGGFLSCVTSFVLGVCLKKTGEFKGFLFGHLVLHLAVLMLIG